MPITSHQCSTPRMRRRAAGPANVIVLLGVVVGTLSPPLSAQSAPNPQPRFTAERMARSLEPAVQLSGEPVSQFMLDERMAHFRVPGVTVAFMRSGRVEWARGWGTAHAGSGRPVDSATRFQAASISKPVAALTAISLVAEGRLALDAAINSVLFSWQLPPDSLRRDTAVTLR